MATGLFGGTFDPIHIGHLDVARAARAALGLDVVLVAPARVPPHRTAPQASAAHRFAMTALALEDEPGLIVSDVDMESTGPSYTADTLARLRAAGLDLSRLVFIAGADAFRDIESWKDYPNFLSLCHFVVVSRPDVPVAGLRQQLPALAGRMHDTPCTWPAQPSILLVDASTAPVSSTIVRRALAEHLPLDGLVPAGVATYISRTGLYGAQVAPLDRKGNA